MDVTTTNCDVVGHLDCTMSPDKIEYDGTEWGDDYFYTKNCTKKVVEKTYLTEESKCEIIPQYSCATIWKEDKNGEKVSNSYKQ